MQPGKNKSMVYLLFLAVAVVWGIVLQKVFFKPEEESFKIDRPNALAENNSYSRYETKTDTFKLVLSYRDPFLNNTRRIVDTNTNETKVHLEPVIAPATKPVATWPDVKYNGRIVNPLSKKAVAIISVNGTERMVEEGQTFKEVKLLKNKRDSILVRWNGLQKYFKQ
jgi:hypothetical protein